MLHFQETMKNNMFSGFWGYDFSSRESTMDLETRPGLIFGVLERSLRCRNHLRSNNKRCQQNEAYEAVFSKTQHVFQYFLGSHVGFRVLDIFPNKL